MSNPSLLIAALLGVSLGVFLGVLIGVLFARGRSSALQSDLAAEIAKSKVLTEQLENLRKEESEKVRLDQSLQAVTQTITTLSKQTQEA